MNIQLFIMPITLILLGILLNFKTFHNIGGNGYASPFSKKSQETWLFAQQVAPKIILKNGLILFLIITYELIESKLRKKFPNL